jgi:hypothetical protein
MIAWELDVLAAPVGSAIDPYLGLLEVLRLRSASHQLLAHYEPTSCSPLWVRVRPTTHYLRRAIAAITREGVWLLRRLYPRGYWQDIQDRLILPACRVGNVDFADLYWSGHRYEVARINGLHAALENGQTTTAAWLLQMYGLALSDLDPVTFYLIKARDVGDTRMADWLLDSGYELRAVETGRNLLIGACTSGLLNFAAWVLRRFPIDMSDGLLSRMATCACDAGAACSARWLIEAFDVSPTDVAEMYNDLMAALEYMDDDQSRQTRAWLARTYST